jgi:acetyltransferase-like isoleucine patch superfamily enzyme
VDSVTRNLNSGEGRTSTIGSAYFSWLYEMTTSRGLRALLRRLALKLEGGAMYSLTVRELYRRYHDLEVGLYTIGPCEAGPDNLDPGTRIGRYCSIYYTVRTITRDYPSQVNLQHGLFFDPALGVNRANPAALPWLEIGNDVFIGHNAVILPTTERIGDGAFIGAGSVVQNPVPPYAVVMGNPARVVRYRFSESKIKELIETAWWSKSIDELSGEMAEFQKPLEGDAIV